MSIVILFDTAAALPGSLAQTCPDRDANGTTQLAQLEFMTSYRCGPPVDGSIPLLAVGQSHHALKETNPPTRATTGISVPLCPLSACSLPPSGGVLQVGRCMKSWYLLKLLSSAPSNDWHSGWKGLRDFSPPPCVSAAPGSLQLLSVSCMRGVAVRVMAWRKCCRLDKAMFKVQGGALILGSLPPCQDPGESGWGGLTSPPFCPRLEVEPPAHLPQPTATQVAAQAVLMPVLLDGLQEESVSNALLTPAAHQQRRWHLEDLVHRLPG
ncbi:hypothetical protein EYF80_007638 [Liparis tanakae]|uniref:Uncharacterized protein n=1 Tax=Liparis tanakae TaxID=230148 RepID=A0A4Z2IXI1_9TELE|nr:hypothetical protein EYF80_007638 [Liparis tanakae]